MTDKPQTALATSAPSTDRIHVTPRPKGARIQAFDADGGEFSSADITLLADNLVDMTVKDAHVRLHFRSVWSVTRDGVNLRGTVNGRSFTFRTPFASPVNTPPDRADASRQVATDALPALTAAQDRLIQQWRALSPELHREMDMDATRSLSDQPSSPALLSCATCALLLGEMLMGGGLGFVLGGAELVVGCGGACA